MKIICKSSNRATGLVCDRRRRTYTRLATEIARRLCGKHKTDYTPHVDTGDYIVVVNADKVKLPDGKHLIRCITRTGYPGGLKQASFTHDRTIAGEGG